MRRAAAWLATGLLIALVVPAIGDAGRGSQGGASKIGRLRANSVAITAERQAAVVRLYALDTKLAQAHAELRSVQQRLTAIRRERSEIRSELRVARRGVAVADRRLAKRLRLLYEQGEVNSVEILLGASSLDDALTALDSLDHTAALDRRVLNELRAARTRLSALDRTLAKREASLSRVAAEAAAIEKTLAGAREERASYVARLGREQRLTKARIAALQQQARLAELRSAELVSGRTDPTNALPGARAPAGDAGSPAPVPAPEPAPAPTPEPAPGGVTPAADAPRTLTVVATGYAIHGNTATGLPTGWGIAAVDPSVIPLGTRFTVPGYGEAVAADVGSGVRGATIDLWFPTVGQALAWGRRTVTIVLH